MYSTMPTHGYTIRVLWGGGGGGGGVGYIKSIRTRGGGTSFQDLRLYIV